MEVEKCIVGFNGNRNIPIYKEIKMEDYFVVFSYKGQHAKRPQLYINKYTYMFLKQERPEMDDS